MRKIQKLDINSTPATLKSPGRNSYGHLDYMQKIKNTISLKEIREQGNESVSKIIKRQLKDIATFRAKRTRNQFTTIKNK